MQHPTEADQNPHPSGKRRVRHPERRGVAQQNFGSSVGSSQGEKKEKGGGAASN
jgi:hypothetical protein